MSKAIDALARKLHNTQALIDFIEGACKAVKAKPSTRAGAAMSVYVMAIVDQAATESITLARRNLDREIEMLHAIRQGANAEEMAQIAIVQAAQHNQKVTTGT